MGKEIRENLEGEAIFHPKINKRPSRFPLERIKNKKNKKFMGSSDIEILKKFCEILDKESSEADKFLKDLKECVFQPNIHKFVEAEKLERSKLYKKTSKNQATDSEEKICNNNLKKVTSEDAFEMIDNSLMKIHDMSIDNWIKEYFKQKNEDSENCGRKTATHKSLYPWERDNREPLYRNSKIRFHCSVDEMSANQEPGSQVICLDNGINKNEAQLCRKKSSWEDDLRGGYITTYLDFSNDITNKKSFSSTKLLPKRTNNIDWGKYIRFSGRDVEAKLFPSLLPYEIAFECSGDSSIKEEPFDYFVHNRVYKLREDNQPNSELYTRSRMINFVKRNRDLQRRNCMKIEYPRAKTVFQIKREPPSNDIHNRFSKNNNMQSQIKELLGRENTFIPRVIGIQKDKISILENVVKQPIPKLLENNCRNPINDNKKLSLNDNDENIKLNEKIKINLQSSQNSCPAVINEMKNVFEENKVSKEKKIIKNDEKPLSKENKVIIMKKKKDYSNNDYNFEDYYHYDDNSSNKFCKKYCS